MFNVTLNKKKRGIILFFCDSASLERIQALGHTVIDLPKAEDFEGTPKRISLVGGGRSFEKTNFEKVNSLSACLPPHVCLCIHSHA